MSEAGGNVLCQTSPSLGLEETEENCISPLQKATQDDEDIATPQSEVSFWAHPSSVEEYCRHYGKKIDGPIPKWRLRSLYPNAPSTYSGCTPPMPSKKRRLDPDRISPASSPCERSSLR